LVRQCVSPSGKLCPEHISKSIWDTNLKLTGHRSHWGLQCTRTLTLAVIFFSTPVNNCIIYHYWVIIYIPLFGYVHVYTITGTSLYTNIGSSFYISLLGHIYILLGHVYILLGHIYIYTAIGPSCYTPLLGRWYTR
jgi:hypothetical protein